MADYGILFQLILASLTFVVIGMGFIVYVMIIGERQKKRLREKQLSTLGKEATHECQHFLGYLSGYPKNQPTPEECFGCAKAIECMEEQETIDNMTEVAKSAEAQ